MTNSIRRISYNVNGANVPDRAYLLDHISKYQPTTLLVMDNGELAVQTYNASGGKTKVVHRAWTAQEGQEWWVNTPADWVKGAMAWGHPEIYRYVVNEPMFDGTHTLRMFCDWLVDVMTRLKMAGYHGVVGNWSVGSYQPQDVENGSFDRLLTEYAKQFKGWHYIGMHEYTLALLPFGVGQWNVELLLDRNMLQPDKWPTNLPIARVGSFLPGYWYLLRSAWLMIRAKSLNIAMPDFWLTEFGWDQIDVGGTPNVKEGLIQRYGTAGYTGIRGIHSLANVWRYYWPQWDVETAAFEQLKWANKVYPDNYVGMNLFSWTAAQDWRQAGVDVSDLHTLHNMLIAETNAGGSVPVPPPTDDSITLKLTPNETALLRTAANFLIGKLPKT